MNVPPAATPSLDGPAPPPADEIAGIVRRALAEDVGDGDLTVELLPVALQARARVIAREPAVICGRPWFDEVYRQLDPAVRIAWLQSDGAPVEPNQVVCELAGPARALLSGERTALNFLQTLSGTATVTRRYVEATAGTGVRVLDTRKTLPGLRHAQKYAVRCGGGHNHRMGLYDAILIKENHILAAGGITAAVLALRARHPAVPVEVEVESMEELREALGAGVERILLDDFELEGIRGAVAETRGRARLEVSGGVELSRLAAIAATGVDDVSVGALTKHVRAVDLSMRFAPPEQDPSPPGKAEPTAADSPATHR